VKVLVGRRRCGRIAGRSPQHVMSRVRIVHVLGIIVVVIIIILCAASAANSQAGGRAAT
jgi:hypothetical protein